MEKNLQNNFSSIIYTLQRNKFTEAVILYLEAKTGTHQQDEDGTISSTRIFGEFDKLVNIQYSERVLKNF